MDHILKTIETFEAKISEHEQEIYKLRGVVNQICLAAGMEQKYQLDENATGTASNGGKPLSAIKPDEFFNKPLSTAVRHALNALRSAGKAPASVESIYDVLVSGGYAFDQKGRDASIQSLSISIGKNSALFVKLPSGLIGVKDWYGEAPKYRRKDSNGPKTEESGGQEESAQTAENAPGQGDENTAGGLV